MPTKSKSPEISDKLLARYISIAFRKGNADDCLKTLPDVGMTAVKSSAYWRIVKADQEIERWNAERESALEQFVTDLVRDDANKDGWTREEIRKAFDF